MKIKTLITGALLIFLLMTSCTTTAAFSSRVSLGMTKSQVIKECGKPYKQTAKYDLAGRTKEVLFYKKRVWLDGGRGGDYTIVTHIFVFRNGKLIAIEQGEEESHTSKGEGNYRRY